MLVRHLIEEYDDELFWESLQDHGWKLHGDVLVSPDDVRITVKSNRSLCYRALPVCDYSDTSYAQMLKFEKNKTVQKKMCHKVPQLLKFASESVQLAVVRQNGLVIGYIRDPSEAVKSAAVRQNGLVIGFIRDPSEAVQLAAVQEDGRAIRHIENPSEAIKLAAVRQD